MLDICSWYEVCADCMQCLHHLNYYWIFLKLSIPKQIKTVYVKLKEIIYPEYPRFVISIQPSAPTSIHNRHLNNTWQNNAQKKKQRKQKHEQCLFTHG